MFRNKKLPHKFYMKPRFLLLAIVLFALTLRLIFFTGVNTSDDAIYYNSVHEILAGNFHPGFIMTLRLLLLYPTAFFFYLFGASNFSAGLWPLICSLGTLILIYKIGKLIFDEKVGLLAAFLFSFYPLEVIYGTRLTADLPTELFITASLFLFLKGLKGKGKPNVFYFLSGIALGLSYLVKELGLLLFVFYFAYMILEILRKRKINWNYSFIFLGFLLVFLFEGFFYYSATGDFLHRFHESINTYSATSNYWGKGIEPKDILTFYPPAMLNLSNYYPSPNTSIYGFFFYFVFASIVYLLLKKEKRAYLLILMFLSMFLYMQAGTRSLTRYLIFGKEMRFLTIITAPSLILIAAFLTSNKKFMRILLPISLIFLLATSIFYIYFLSDYLEYGMGECGCMRISDIKQIAEFIKNNPRNTFYVHEGTYDNIRFFLEFNTTSLKSATNMNETGVKGSYVVFNSSLPLLNDCRFEREKHIETAPDFLCKPPEGWKLVKIIGGRGGDTDREYNPAIYYAE